MKKFDALMKHYRKMTPVEICQALGVAPYQVQPGMRIVVTNDGNPVVILRGMMETTTFPGEVLRVTENNAESLRAELEASTERTVVPRNALDETLRRVLAAFLDLGGVARPSQIQELANVSPNSFFRLRDELQGVDGKTRKPNGRPQRLWDGADGEWKRGSYTYKPSPLDIAAAQTVLLMVENNIYIVPSRGLTEMWDITDELIDYSKRTLAYANTLGLIGEDEYGYDPAAVFKPRIDPSTVPSSLQKDE